MKKNLLLPILTLTVLCLSGVWFISGTDFRSGTTEFFKGSVFLLPREKPHNNEARVKSKAHRKHSSDHEIYLPEVRTHPAIHFTPTKATLEGRVKKFEYIDGPEPARTGDKEFRGGVLVKDGRIVLVPRTGKFVGEYDPKTNTVSQTTFHGQDGGFGMGSVLDNGYTVILTPRGSRNVGIYDARTQTYRDGVAHGRPEDNAFLGSVKISEELIVFGPLLSPVTGLYNPKTDTYKDGPPHNETDRYNFSVITRSAKTGDVIFTPFMSEHVGIYKPSENIYISGAAHNANTNDAYSGSVELENGLIIMAPRKARHIGIYDPMNDTFMKGCEHGENDAAFMAAELMDGEVIMAPFRADHIGIYNPETNEYRSGPSVAHVPGIETGRFSGAILTQSKDMLVMTNRGANVIGLVKVNRFFEDGRKAKVFFRYRQQGEGRWKQTRKLKISKADKFSINVSGLKSSAEYEYKSVIHYQGLEKEGEVRLFITGGM